jgi:hypothetical protein
MCGETGLTSRESQVAMSSDRSNGVDASVTLPGLPSALPGRVKLPNEMLIKVLDMAFEDAYPDYLRRAPLTEVYKDIAHCRNRPRGSRQVYGHCNTYIMRGGGCRGPSEDTREPLRIRQVFKIFHGTTDLVYHKGTLEFVKRVRSFAAVSTLWAQVCQYLLEQKLQDIRGTWEEFEKSSMSRRGCLGQRTSYDVEWKALFQCSRQLLLLRYSIENRLGYDDDLDNARLTHDIKRQQGRNLKLSMSVEELEADKASAETQNKSQQLDIERAEARASCLEKENEQLRKEKEKLLTRSRAAEKRLRNKQKELQTARKRNADEDEEEEDRLPPSSRLRSSTGIAAVIK